MNVDVTRRHELGPFSCTVMHYVVEGNPCTSRELRFVVIIPFTRERFSLQWSAQIIAFEQP